MANEIVIAGPELVAATVPVMTKIPAPMMTPTPKTIRSRVPRLFLSLCSGSSVSRIDRSTDFVRMTSMTGTLLVTGTYDDQGCGARRRPTGSPSPAPG